MYTSIQQYRYYHDYYKYICIEENKYLLDIYNHASTVYWNGSDVFHLSNF